MCVFAKLFSDGLSPKFLWMLSIMVVLALTIFSDGAFSLVSNNKGARSLSSVPKARISTVFTGRNSIESVLPNTPFPAEVPPLPWTKSVKPERDLTYMPLLQRQLEKIRSMGFEEISLKDEFTLRSSTVKPAKIGNLCFRGGNFRKIRVTYFDAGDGVQVFNTLWYPKYEYDIPLLGIDLISLGTSRVLTVIDTQPLYPTEEYNQKYIAGFKGIRDKYPDLQGVLSGKIYDDTSFFSKQMLFGRFTDESKVRPVVYPAFEEYLNAYLNLAEGATPNHDARAIDAVKARQTEYDKYSALKDPAVGLFDAYFGKEWSHSFVHDFLFDLSDSLVKDSAPVHNFQIAGPTISAGNNPLVSAPPVTQKAKVQSPLLSIISRIKAPLVFGISQSIADASAYAALPPAEHQ